MKDKSKLRTFLKQKQEKWKEIEELELRGLKNTKEVWNYIKKRGGKTKIRNNVGKEK